MASPPPGFITRGRLAARLGCNSETIRYYERVGLMAAPMRSARGYRLYNESAQTRLRFILRARGLGFGIAELSSLLGLLDRGNYGCGEIRDLTVRHLDEVRAKIADLRRLERTLAEISARCEGGDIPECPIIDALNAA